ncbi:MAG: hypothetical protein C4345_15220, partial [Chloroflexota bacterium]
PPALLARLTHRLQLLTGGPRDLPERLQTMRRAVAWSYDLLADEHRQVFRQLSVFPGPFSLDAAEAVVGRGTGPESISGSPDVFDALAALIDASLLVKSDDAGLPGEHDSPRFRMLATIREYGLEQLAAAGEEEDARNAHAAWAAALVDRAASQLWGPDGERWLGVLATEHDYVIAALSWLIQADPQGALKLASGLWWFWQTRGHLSEGRTWLGRLRRQRRRGSGRRHSLAQHSWPRCKGMPSRPRCWLRKHWSLGAPVVILDASHGRSSP